MSIDYYLDDFEKWYEENSQRFGLGNYKACERVWKAAREIKLESQQPVELLNYEKAARHDAAKKAKELNPTFNDGVAFEISGAIIDAYLGSLPKRESVDGGLALDLALMCKHLAYRLNNMNNGNIVAKAAMDFLLKHNMQGSPFRVTQKWLEKRIASEPDDTQLDIEKPTHIEREKP